MKNKHLFFVLLIFPIFACSDHDNAMNNPLLSVFNTPYHSIPFEEISPEHFRPAFDTAFNRAGQEIQMIKKIEEAPDFNNTIVALENSAKMLQTLSQTMFNLNAAETDSSLQKLTKDISPRLANFKNSITLDPVLFSKVKSVYENTGRNSLTTEQITLLENTYKDFVRSGANLDSLKKEEYRAITEELAKLSVEFDENVLTETNEYILHITDSNDLSGLSDNILKAAKEEAMNRNLEGWVFTLHYSSYSSFMKYADNRALREKLFKAYNSRGNHKNDHNNCDIIHRITELRLRQANLLGYPDYAAYILDRRMAETPENVYTFLEDLIKAYHEAATQDVDNIRSYAKAAGINFELTYWDLNYYSEKLKKEHFDINDESTRPYFRLENVEKGIFRLARELYGITFQENKSVQVYHPDVKVYEVHDTDNGLVGLLYMDYFPREGKKQGAWMTEYVQQQKTGGQDIRPHISLVFNFSKPTEEKPSLLTYREVRTLLHEFGHAMHGLFSDVTYSSLSGTSVYRDFVELPSQIMENWAEEKEWLHWVAMHYETGEKMPDDMIDKIIESKNFMKAYGTYRQISFGLTDMAWHTITNAGEKDVESFEKEAMEPVNLLPWVEGTAISPSFSHIFAGGYAAGYYGYKWAEVLDADAFSLFKEKGIFDKKTAADFREHILSKGGTDHPMTLYVKFRGHKPSIEPLLTRSGIQTHGI